MAGFINKFLNSMKLNDDEDEFEPDDEFDLDYTDDEPVRRSSARRFAAAADDDIDDDALTEESYRTTYDANPDDLNLEAADLSDDDDAY
jgi:hypothetical protein